MFLRFALSSSLCLDGDLREVRDGLVSLESMQLDVVIQVATLGPLGHAPGGRCVYRRSGVVIRVCKPTYSRADGFGEHRVNFTPDGR